MSHTAELIAVGTELLLGNIANTDAQTLSRELSALGINVYYHTVVGDNPERLKKAVEIAKTRADLIITTGGLGPTCDDLTKQILARAFGLELVRNEAEYQGLYEYIQPGKTFTPNNFQQAMLPEGCTVFHNEWGTAPGCAFEKDRKTVIMLPGPPKECNAMFRACVIPYLKKFADGEIVSHSLRIFGLGESAVDQMFRDEMNAMTNPSMAPYAKECDCLLQVTAKAETREEAEEMLKPVIAHVKEKLGEVVYGMDVECVEEAVIGLLREKHMRFSAAESCTGGMVAAKLVNYPGISAALGEAQVTYANEAKVRYCGVRQETLDAYGAVSEQTAREMAQGLRERSGADIVVATTGIAGPSGGTKEKPVGLVYVACADRCGTEVVRLNLGGSRERIRTLATLRALDMVRRSALRHE